MRKLCISALVVALAACTGGLGSARAGEHGHSVMSEVDRVCEPHPDRAAHEARFSEFLAERLNLNDVQKSAFKDFQAAREKAVEAATTRLCAKKPDLSSFEARLDFHQAFLEDRLEAVKSENPKLIAFYKSLDDRQKAKFEKIRERLAGKMRR
jgi:LTXXQ motif family protein